MDKFPRIKAGGISLPRMIIGTNWFLGYSHTSSAKDTYIKKEIHNRQKIADILEVFMEAGINAIMGILIDDEIIMEAIKEAEQRTGEKMIKISTPTINVKDSEQARKETEEIFDQVAAIEAEFCLPHHSSVEQLVDKGAVKIKRIDDYTEMIRERKMIPGLSAHMPEIVKYADDNNNDVETYIQLYNVAGFLMQFEVEYVNKIIHNAKKPVMTIKPMAAGRLSPFVGLSFVWNTIREQDMVTVGTMSPEEAAEVIEISKAALEKRRANIEGRGTTSEGSVISED